MGTYTLANAFEKSYTTAPICPASLRHVARLSITWITCVLATLVVGVYVRHLLMVYYAADDDVFQSLAGNALGKDIGLLIDVMPLCAPSYILN